MRLRDGVTHHSKILVSPALSVCTLLYA